jgi:cold-inducible RNA-binding protein
MSRRLYVGNLPYKATDEELTQLFGSVGNVTSARVMRDMATGRARGFGFVEMATDEAAQKAIEKFHQYEMEGRQLVVNEARPKPEGGSGRSFGGGGGFDRGGNRGGSDAFGGSSGAGGRREPRW